MKCTSHKLKRAKRPFSSRGRSHLFLWRPPWFVPVFKYSYVTACTSVIWGAYLEYRLLNPNPRDLDAEHLSGTRSLYVKLGPPRSLRHPMSRAIDLVCQVLWRSLELSVVPKRSPHHPPISLLQTTPPTKSCLPSSIPGLIEGYCLYSVSHAESCRVNLFISLDS